MKTLCQCKFMPSTQVATTLTADTASCGYCFSAALKLLTPACIYQGKFSFSVVNSTFLYDICCIICCQGSSFCDQSPGWQDINCHIPVFTSLCRCSIMVSCVFFLCVCVCRKAIGKKSLHWMCRRLRKNLSCQKHCQGDCAAVNCLERVSVWSSCQLARLAFARIKGRFLPNPNPRFEETRGFLFRAISWFCLQNERQANAIANNRPINVPARSR